MSTAALRTCCCTSWAEVPGATPRSLVSSEGKWFFRLQRSNWILLILLKFDWFINGQMSDGLILWVFLVKRSLEKWFSSGPPILKHTRVSWDKHWGKGKQALHSFKSCSWDWRAFHQDVSFGSLQAISRTVRKGNNKEPEKPTNRN